MVKNNPRITTKSKEENMGNMVFCENCGAKLESGAAFCDNCGAKAAPAPGKTVSSPEAPSPEPANRRAVMTKGVVAAILIIVILIAGGYFAVGIIKYFLGGFLEDIAIIFKTLF
jgi:hypothetical protein